jgi:hypothetical protein
MIRAGKSSFTIRVDRSFTASPVGIYHRARSPRGNTCARLPVLRAQRGLTPRQPKLITDDKDRIARMYWVRSDEA